MNKQINQLVTRLNARLNRPVDGGGVNNGKYSANVGHLYADHAARYGGYRLTEITNTGGGCAGFNTGGTEPRLSCKEFKTSCAVLMMR